jgi:hypothetical protein
VIPAAPPPPAASAARAVPTIEVMVVGRRKTLSGPRSVRLTAGKVTIGQRRCAVPAGTALAGLLATHVKLKVTDIAGCDPTQMFVAKIGPDANHGAAGWEYKVNRSDPGVSAATDHLHGGRTTLLWYWCVRANACQRTLAVKATSAAGSARFTVTGFDDNGHGVPVAGATVHVGSQTLTTDASGTATISASAAAGQQVYATKSGLIRSFPATFGASR